MSTTVVTQSGWRRLGRSGARGSHPIICLYHRVVDLDSDPQLLSVSRRHFAEHLDVVTRCGRVISLEELVGGMKTGHVPQRAVVLTFDDGYADNLHSAQPLLERAGAPATVFIVPAYVGGRHEFWWDELEHLVLQPGHLPESLYLAIDGCPCQWKLGAVGRYVDGAFRRHCDWNVLSEDVPTARHGLYRWMCRVLRLSSDRRRRDVLDQLHDHAGTRSSVRSTHRTLSPDELCHLASGSLIDIGAHSMTHSMLARLSAVEQRNEIGESKRGLEQILGRRVAAFSYPFGTRADYTQETVACVRRSGFACACTSVRGTVHQGSDRYQLPRIIVRNWDGDTFARRLEEAWTRADAASANPSS